MIEQIKQALDKGNHPYNFDKNTRDIFDEDGGTVAMHIYRNEDVEIITKAPDWIWYLIGEVERLEKQQERMLNIARGCTDYGGGYRSDKELFDAYQGGIYTVITALEASTKKNDSQLSALEGIGKGASQ